MKDDHKAMIDLKIPTIKESNSLSIINTWAVKMDNYLQ